jgi:RNA polymerase sigma-70 factor (ECF subfamily)
LTRFYAVLEELGANERTAFVLRHMEGLKLEEVSEHMDLSLATVKRLLRRAAERVSALVERDHELSSYARERGALPGGFGARG